jgi:hypothetical protein
MIMTILDEDLASEANTAGNAHVQPPRESPEGHGYLTLQEYSFGDIPGWQVLKSRCFLSKADTLTLDVKIRFCVVLSTRVPIRRTLPVVLCKV